MRVNWTKEVTDLFKTYEMEFTKKDVEYVLSKSNAQQNVGFGEKKEYLEIIQSIEDYTARVLNQEFKNLMGDLRNRLIFSQQQKK